MSRVSRVLGWKGDGTRTWIDVRGVAGLKIGNGIDLGRPRRRLLGAGKRRLVRPADVDV